jgi:hypothetical protein
MDMDMIMNWVSIMSNYERGITVWSISKVHFT